MKPTMAPRSFACAIYGAVTGLFAETGSPAEDSDKSRHLDAEIPLNCPSWNSCDCRKSGVKTLAIRLYDSVQINEPELKITESPEEIARAAVTVPNRRLLPAVAAVVSQTCMPWMVHAALKGPNVMLFRLNVVPAEAAENVAMMREYPLPVPISA